MSKLILKDFKNLTVKEFQAKLKEATNIDFLQSLLVAEQAEGDRKTVYAAISDRMEEISEEEMSNLKADSSSEPESKDKQLTNSDDESEYKAKSPGMVGIGPEEALNRKKFIEEVKEKRLALDRIFEFAKVHDRVDTSPDDSIFLAKAWLGKMLAALSVESPYKKDEKKEIQSRADIPKTAEKDESTHFAAVCHRFKLLDTFKAAIELRADLQEVIDWIDTVDMKGFTAENPRLAAIARTQAYIHACEAKYFLGVILSNQQV
jgi:hypothetical protein